MHRCVCADFILNVFIGVYVTKCPGVRRAGMERKEEELWRG